MVDQNQINKDELEDSGSLYIFLDYYQRAFILLHNELSKSGYNSKLPHPIRKRYWSLLPYRQYESLEARQLVQSYISLVENELKDIISRNSIAYWLHLYRRLYPGPIGENEDVATIFSVRATLEAAI